MQVPEKFTFDKVTQIYQELRDERSEWEADARTISDWLLPGRGIFQTYTKPRKRKLTTPNVINTIGEDSLYVMTSGIHGRLSSPGMPWFRYAWPSEQLNQMEMLKQWLQQAEKIVIAGLQASNFYAMINSFYVEYGGYGTASIYVGEDTYDDQVPVRYELMTFGEYAVSMGANGLPEVYCRTIFMSPRQMVGHFGEKAVSEEVQRQVKNNESGADKVNLAVLEFVAAYPHQDKEYIRIFYEVTGTGNTGRGSQNRSNFKLGEEPLQVDGFYEFPYVVGRWSTIGSDTYGIGPGSRSIPDIKRLQEMEKAFLMATHKNINPPLNAPANMKGKLNTLPGGKNYYSNPAATVNEVYQVNFDYVGVSQAIERVEQRIQRNFFNDVFITGNRDPNASPLRTGQVNAMQQEQMFRLGPVTERLHSEVFTPALRRTFKIMHRKGMFPPLQPEYEELISQLEVNLVSPMAVAQNKARSQGVDSLIAFTAQVAQFNPAVVDNIDIDAAARNRGDIEGVELGILRTQEQVDEIRDQRAKAQQAQQQKEDAERQAQVGSNVQNTDAGTMKTQAEAGQILAETQQTNTESGTLQ